jgi:exodeoxyribonuclease VII large subunit
MSKSNFFDFRENLLRKPESPSSKPAITVTQLTADIERALKTGLPATISVRGELSNYNVHRTSGHHYFSLKDEGACVDGVMFRSDAARLKFMPTDGMEVVITGRIAVYAQRGRYQLYASAIQPLGKGALEIAFQQMRAKLESEGLFAAERKRPIPTYPLRIVLLTSTSTAALQDMLKVLRRFAFLQLAIYHVPVQGEGAGDRIADAIRHVNLVRGTAQPQAADVIVVARGGGSLEDLWAFNEEAVARAIAASALPVITGIGHEVDVSIADLVADYHAHTPTEAAQIVTRKWRGAADAVRLASQRLARATRLTVTDAKSRLTGIARHEFFRRPTDRVNALRQRLDDIERQLAIALQRRAHRSGRKLDSLSQRLQAVSPQHTIALRRTRLTFAQSQLDRAVLANVRRHVSKIDVIDGRLTALSPDGVLKRGYTMTTRLMDGTIVRSANDLKPGERILTRFSDGQTQSVVEDSKQLRLF